MMIHGYCFTFDALVFYNSMQLNSAPDGNEEPKLSLLLVEVIVTMVESMLFVELRAPR